MPICDSQYWFLTGKPLSNFFINLIIVDEVPELTKDLTLATPMDYDNYNVNIPIRKLLI